MHPKRESVSHRSPLPLLLFYAIALLRLFSLLTAETRVCTWMHTHACLSSNHPSQHHTPRLKCATRGKHCVHVDAHARLPLKQPPQSTPHTETQMCDKRQTLCARGCTRTPASQATTPVNTTHRDSNMRQEANIVNSQLSDAHARLPLKQPPQSTPHTETQICDKS
jgi:hypothetical protein